MKTEVTKNRNKSVAAIFIFAATAALYGFGFFITQKISTEARNAGREGRELAARSREVVELRRIMKETETAREKIDSSFADKDSVIVFIENVERYGKMSDVAVAFSSVNEAKRKSDGLEFTLFADGDFGKIMKFLSLFENSPYKFSLEKVQLQKTPTEFDKAPWKLSISGNLVSYLR